MKRKRRLAAVASLAALPLLLNPFFIGALVGATAVLIRKRLPT